MTKYVIDAQGRGQDCRAGDDVAQHVLEEEIVGQTLNFRFLLRV